MLRDPDPVAGARKVAAPGIGMMACSILGLLYNIGWLVWVFLSDGGDLGTQLARHGISYVMVAAPAVAVIVYAAMLFGSVQMLRRRNYRWAMAASLLALIPCTVFTVLSIGFGIWGIVVLRNADVKAAFGRKQTEED